MCASATYGVVFFFFSSRRRHTRFDCDWSSDVCSSDLAARPTPTPTPSERPKTPLDLPFKVGEQLNYQVYLGTGVQPFGSITLAVRTRGRFFNRDGLQIAATAQTTGSSARVFAVNDQVTSYVDPETLLPFRTELSLSEREEEFPGRHMTKLRSRSE